MSDGLEVLPEQIPSPAEVEAIAAAINPRFTVAVKVLDYVGLRIGELAGLEVSDWLPEQRILRVRRSGPGTDRTKGHRPSRHVDVPKFLADEIDRHVARYCTEEGPLFPTPKGKHLRDQNFRRRYFHPAVDRALDQDSINPNDRRVITPHHLRHTAATIMIYAGVADVEIANQLGHSSSQFTRRVYAGIWRWQEREASRRLDAFLEHRLVADLTSI